MASCMTLPSWFRSRKYEPNIGFDLTYLGVTVLANATTAPTKTQVKPALGGSSETGRFFCQKTKESLN